MGYVRGIRWSNDLIKTKIYEVMNVLNIDRMPSKSECDKVFGNSALSNKIAKSGGFYKIADKLGLKAKRCETETGKGFEQIATDVLIGKGYKVERMAIKYPFDLVNDCIRIDVKASRSHLSQGYSFYTIGINKKYATCDLYLIFALGKKDKPRKIFIIPGCDLRVTTLSFGENSIYNIYLDRWDLIRKYDEFYSNLASVRAGD